MIKKNFALLGGIFLCVFFIGLVTATMTNYVSNSMEAQTTIQTECNDGIDNDGDTFIDLADPDCLNICNKEDDSSYNCL